MSSATLTTDVRRPPLRYHGGKWKLAPWIISLLPAHRVYVEPFGGGAGVLLRKSPSRAEIYNDLDGEVVNVFRVAREQPEQLSRALQLTPYARCEYETLWLDEPTDDPVERARRLIARSFMSVNSKGMFQRSGFDGRLNADGYISRVNSFRNASEVLGEVARRFSSVLIENVSAFELIPRYDSTDTLFYVDPPYVASTRGSRSIYSHDFTDHHHRALAAVLHSLRGMVILSGYRSTLYDELYADWRREEIQAHADGAAARVEVAWLNPAADRALRGQTRMF